MPGYLALPNEALALALSQPLYTRALLALYAQADRLRWEPFAAADSWLRECGGLSTRAARRLLARLIELSLLEVVSPGDRHATRMVVLRCPVRVARTTQDIDQHSVEHQAEHQAEHNNHVASGIIAVERSTKRSTKRSELPDSGSDSGSEEQHPPNPPSPPAPVAIAPSQRVSPEGYASQEPQAAIAQEQASGEQQAEGLPAWVPQSRLCAGLPRAVLLATVVRCLEVIHCRPVLPHRCATDAREVLRLWRALGWLPPEELVAQVELVARAFRTCPEKLFSRDVRAEGWAEGVDRSHSVATLCVGRRWSERLAAAQRWAAAGYPATTATSAATDTITSNMLAFRQQLRAKAAK